MFLFVLPFKKFQENWQSLQRVDDGQQSREHADKESHLLAHCGFLLRVSNLNFAFANAVAAA
jgi:hypothetical protein